MDRISVTLPDETITRLSEEVDQSYDNRSEAVRDLLQKGLEYDDRVNDLETENERLQRQLAATNRRVDEHQELVEYVESERTLSEQRAQAGVLTRAKWWLTGMPAEDDGDGGDEG